MFFVMFPVRLSMRVAREILRPFSSKVDSPIDVTIDTEGIAVMTLQRPPVNSISLEMMQDMDKALDDIAKNKCKGMVLTSVLPKIFSAGLDLNELYNPDVKRLEMFWKTVQDVIIKLHDTEFPSAIAINGYTAAGGFIFSTVMEYRVMVNTATIMFNDSMVGIVPSMWIIDAIRYVLGNREAELATTMSKMYCSEEAFKVGLVDELATDKADAVEKCKQFIRRFDNIPALARNITKQRMRQDTLKWLHLNKQRDIEECVQKILNPQTQEILGMYIQKLKQKKVSK